MRKTSQMNSRNPKKFKPTPAKFIIGTLMILFAITGCSDMPYTGSGLTVLEVNRYLVSTDGESVCFQDDLNATCIRLLPETQNVVDENNRPAVYIYPERRVYMLYHEGAPILRAERAQITPIPTDTPENTSDDDPSTPNGQTGNNNGNNNNNGGGNNGDPTNNNDDGHGWIIWVYYPKGASPNNAPTLSGSGVVVTINGRQLTDADITGFAQFIGSDGERGVQFFYPTQSAELLDLKIRIEGVVSDDETVKFNINYLWNAQ